MGIGKDTKLCISISTNPGNTGAFIHNTLAHDWDQNYVYVPRLVSEDCLGQAILGVRTLGIAGCSVSMPFKRRVIKFIDGLEGDAETLRIVNTIRREDDQLVGYNTDVFGIESILPRGEHATIIGAGATAHSAVLALSRLGYRRVSVWNRTLNPRLSLQELVRCQGLLSNVIESIDDAEGDVLINATSLGMGGERFPITDGTISRFGTVLDVVVGDTDLVRRSHSLGVATIEGYHMAVFQAAKQFAIYTHAPETFNVKECAENLLGEA